MGKKYYNPLTGNWVDSGTVQDDLKKNVDVSAENDAYVNGYSRSEIDSKWGAGTSDSIVNSYNNASGYDSDSSYDGGYTSSSSGSSSSRGITKYLNMAKANAAANKSTSSILGGGNGTGYYTYNPVSGYYERVVNRNNKSSSLSKEEDPNYYGILDNKDKTSPDTTYRWTGKEGETTPLLNGDTLTNQAAQNTNVDLTGNVNQNMNKWGDFTSAVNDKLQTAFGMQDLNELRERYPEQYSSLIQSLDAVAGTWNALDPSQRGMLEGQLQAIIGTAVGAGSDMSKLNVLESSIMDKFKDADRVKSDAQNVIKLQTQGLTTSEIADQMGMSEDQVHQLVLLANGLDSKAGEYYELTDKAAKDITEPYDTQIERLEEEKKIQLDRANRQIEWMKEDFDKNLERQKKANEINAHNADFLSGQFGYGFSKRGIEGLDYVADQAQQIIDDMVTNYDRNNIEMAEGVTDILRNWEWNNEDLLKASEDALTQAKNAYTSNMLAIQQQYGTVGMQAQQQLANNVQNFITQAESIYDNALNRQQQNLTNLITNFSNLNALQYSNLTLRNAQIQQFQQESMNLNRNQLQGLAQQLGMDSASFQDLVNYQAQAVANQLNGYIPGSGMQMQSQIKSYLDQGYTPNQALSMIMNSSEFQNMQATGGNGEWKVTGDYMYNTSTGERQSLSGAGAMTGADGTNYVASQTVNGKTYGVSEKTMNGLQDFINSHQIGSTGGQCGKFVNDYLQSLGLGRVFTDPIDKKAAAINTEEGYQPQVGDIIVMDSPSARKYGHVAIVTAVNGDGTITTLESNKKGEGQVFSRTFDPTKQSRIPGNRVYGYYHPDGVMASNAVSSAGGTGGNMSDYDINTAVMRIGRMAYGANISNNESERVEKVLRDGANMGKNQTEILYDVLGMRITNNLDKAEPFIDIMVQNSDKDGLSAYNTQGFSDFINIGEYEKAMNLVEQAVAKERGGSFASDMAKYENGSKYLYTKGNDIIDLIEDQTNKLGIVAGNFENKWTKFVKDEDFQKLKSSLANLVADWRHDMIGSAATETELKMLEDLIPVVTDNPYNAIAKIQELQDKWLTDYNGVRGNLYLPAVDSNSLLDKSQRVQLYFGNTGNRLTPIEMVQNTVSNYQTQSQGRIGSNLQAGGKMQSGKRL